jgi:hypothetical protein
MKSAITNLRPAWQAAAFGAIAAGLTSLPLVTCRGVGLIDFIPERIPGDLFAALTGMHDSHSIVFYAVCFLATGALIGLAYRQAFAWLERGGWSQGMALGVLQWGITGMLIALLSPLLPLTPLLLPAEDPDETAFGLACFLLLFGVHLLYGTLLGEVLLIVHEREELFEQREEEPPAAEMPRAA